MTDMASLGCGIDPIPGMLSSISKKLELSDRKRSAAHGRASLEGSQGGLPLAYESGRDEL